MADQDHDIIVLGGGPGGLIVSGAAASLGLKVALVEKGKLGGECFNYGCIPSKSMIHAASIARTLKKAQRIGLDVKVPPLEFRKITDYIHEVQKTLGASESRASLEKQGVAVIEGYANFIDGHTVNVNGDRISAKKFVIATGSKPLLPPIEGLKSVGYQTNETVFSMEKLPASMLVVGGGAIGLELAQTFARFGCNVTVLETAERLFVQDDPEVGALMEKVLTDEGLNLVLGCDIKKFYDKNGRKTALVKHQGQQKEFEAEEVLVAAGRVPNIASLDLQLARVKYDKNGIKVNRRLRTTAPNIWACGDAVGPHRYTHMATYQAGVVIANMIFRYPRRAHYDLVPRCTFTDPEVTQFGLTESTAREKGVKHQTVRFDFKDLDRAVCDDAGVGFLKLLIRKDRIIGGACVGPDASNIIPELILAAGAKLSVLKISRAIHIYPSLAQINAKAVGTYLGQKYSSRIAQNMARFMFNLLT